MLLHFYGPTIKCERLLKVLCFYVLWCRLYAKQISIICGIVINQLSQEYYIYCALSYSKEKRYINIYYYYYCQAPAYIG